MKQFIILSASSLIAAFICGNAAYLFCSLLLFGASFFLTPAQESAFSFYMIPILLPNYVRLAAGLVGGIVNWIVVDRLINRR